MASAIFKSSGAVVAGDIGLPSAPLGVPLRAQLSVNGGACFEGTYGADGVRANLNGVFRARGTP